MIKFILFINHSHHFSLYPEAILQVIWSILILFVLSLLVWLLVSPFEFIIDTRVPVVMVRWITIGKIILVYEDEEWHVKMQVLFFNWKRPLSKIIFSRGTKKKPAKKITKRKGRYMSLQKLWQLFNSFRIDRLEVVISNDNMINNAWLYPLNFLPSTRQHVHVNFIGENYLLLIIRNTGWRMLYAFIK